MANKVSYANLKLKVDNTVNTFDFNGNKIEVLNYLPVEDKYDLIMITIQKAKENGYYNGLKIDVFFHLHLVYMYTNLSFTDKQREDEMKLYDTLKSNGFIDKMLLAIPENEYNELYTYIEDIVSSDTEYMQSFASIVKTIVEDLPKNAQMAAEIVDNFNPEKYQQVVNFAKTAGMR